MSETLLHAPTRQAHGAPFKRILCAVDGTREADVALQQAIALAGDDSKITVAAVWSEESPLGRTAWDVVDQAVATARAAGARASRRLIQSPHVADAPLATALGHDLLVIGCRPHSRARGILSADLSTAMAHRAACSVLLARSKPLTAGVLAASDCLPRTCSALTAATLIANRLATSLTVLHVRELDDRERHRELAAELTNARALLGRDLRYVTETGGTSARIVAAARAPSVGLVVTGSSGKRGVAALGSTSERVAHQAPCSVLIVPGR
jgi:nucleotide-binding universal stress UspA family protein